MAVILHVRERQKDSKGNFKRAPVQLIIIHPEVGYEVEISLSDWQQLLLGSTDIVAQVKHHWEIENG